jgi:hypothetical protein
VEDEKLRDYVGMRWEEMWQAELNVSLVLLIASVLSGL